MEHILIKRYCFLAGCFYKLLTVQVDTIFYLLTDTQNIGLKTFIITQLKVRLLIPTFTNINMTKQVV